MADAAPAAPAAAPASAGGGFLAGATVGSGSSPSSPSTGGFLANATVGKAAAAPAPKTTQGTGAFSNMAENSPLEAPAGGPQLDTSKPLPTPNIVSTAKPVDTSAIGSKFLAANPDLAVPGEANPEENDTSTPAIGKGALTTPQDSTPLGIATNTVEGLPAAAAKVSGAINNAIIQKPADLLSNTKYFQQVGAGMSADPSDFGSNFAVSMLQKLSLGLNTISGVTGGLYEAPDTDPDNGVLDQGITAITQGLGMAVGVGAIGKVAAAVPAVSAVTDSLTQLVGKFPLVGKYIAPYIAPLVENTAGFSAYSQLNPQLGANLRARATTFATSIGEAPLYTALGALQSAKFSLPASFALGYGMAKLSGASNQDAATAGAAFAFLDAAGRAGGERGNTPEEQQAINDQKITDEAYRTLSKYSGIKVTSNSTDDELKTAYRKAIHVAHPDAGGTQESGAAVNNAYSVVTKGRVAAGGSKPTEEEQSVSTLRAELKEGVATHGADATKIAAQENLGIDQPTADRLVRAAQSPSSSEEVSEASKNALAKLKPGTAHSVNETGTNGEPTGNSLTVSIPSDETLASEAAANEESHSKGAGRVSSRGDIVITGPRGQEINRLPYTQAVQKYQTTDRNALAQRIVNPHSGYNYQTEKYEGVPVAGVDAKQFGRLGPEEAAPLAKVAAERYQKEVIEPARKRGEPTVIGADDLKDHFGGDYNDNNHPVYSQAAFSLYERALTENKDPNVVFTGGGPGSGKTELITNSLKDAGYKGIVYDSNLTNYEGAVKQIDMARTAGKQVRIYGSLPNLEATRGFTLAREEKTGRGITDKTFANNHVGFPETLQKLLENGIVKPEDVRLFDNRLGTSKEEAKAKVKESGHVENPLATLAELGYNREDIATKYAKDNYTKTEEGRYVRGSGSVLPKSEVRGSTGEISARNGTDTAGKERLRPAAPKDTERNAEKSQQQKAEEGLLDRDEKGRFLDENGDNEIVEQGNTPNSPKKIKLTPTMDRELGTLMDEIKSDPGLSEDWHALQAQVGKGKALSLSDGMLNELESELKNIVDKDAEEFPQNARAAQADLNKIKKLNTQRGFVNPGAVADSAAGAVKQLKTLIEHHQKVDDVVGQISNSIYKEEGANKVLKVQLTKLVDEARKLSTPAERKNVYAYMEDSSEPLTDNEKKNVLPIVEAMDKTLEQLRAKARAEGIYITGDILDEMTPRNAIEKGGVIDKALEAYQQGKKVISNGGKLTTSVGSGSKHRVYHILTDENGQRTLVAVKDGKVTAISKGQSTELGSTKRVITPKVKEFFDESTMTKLNNLAKDLGVTHERVATGRSEGLPPSRAGVSYGGADLIKTRLSPTSVLAHELGHQIDDKYGMKAVMKAENYDKQRQKEVRDEMRALADQRFEGREVSDNFKKYVRKDSEKMAVMFEAYVANKEMFQQVAPHLYDDFRDFLSSHAELRPFLDIKPSISLGSEQHGGEHVGGIAGREFVDDSGKSYIVGQATTKEIEANTNTRYYKDPLANYALAIERTARAVRANALLTKIKESPQFKDAIKNINEDTDIPADFKSTRLDQLRNFRMEPKLAEAFDDLAARQQGSDGGLLRDVYDQVNNVLITILVINPVMHYPNVAIGWGAQVAAAGVVPERDFMTTFKQVMNKDPEYLKWVENGAPFQYLRETNAQFADSMLHDVLQDVEQNPTHYEEIAKMLGHANPLEWAKSVEKFSADATWVANDVMLFNALKTYQKANDSTYQQAIDEVSKRMPDYRVPPRVLGFRALSTVMQNNAIFMFMRYHYSGVIKPWISNIGDTFDPRGEGSGGPSGKQRMAGIRTLSYFAMMYFIYSMVDKELQRLTGKQTTYMSMAGPMRLAQNVVKSIDSESPLPALNTFALTPSLDIIGSLLIGYDFSNYFNPIYGPGGEGVGPAFANQASVYQGIQGAFTGGGNWENYALSLGGVYSPKTTVQTATLNAMLNVEKLQVEDQAKADIAAGNTTAATAAVKDFNDRLKSAIQASLVSNGKSGDAAQVNYYFQTFPNGLGQKGYALRMPSATTVKNYAAKQGETSAQKLFGKAFAQPAP